MDKKFNKLYHRIKYRKSVDPNYEQYPEPAILKVCDIPAKKRERIQRYLLAKTRKTKIKETLNIKIAPYQPIWPHQSSTNNDMYEFAENCPLTQMSRFLEKKILKKVCTSLNNPILVKEIMREAQEEFERVVHQTGIGMKLKEGGCSSSCRVKLEPYRYLGRTENYKNFLKIRRKFHAKFLLHYPIIRKILSQCVTLLPYELFSLSIYMTRPLDIKQFEEQLQEIIDKISGSLREFYANITGLVERKKTLNLSSILTACTGLLSVNISQTITNTLSNVVKFTKYQQLKTSYLKVNVVLDNNLLILQPSADDIVLIYRNFLDKIINCAKQFYVLQRNESEEYRNKTIYLCLTDEFLDNCAKEISENITKDYSPVVEYIAKLDNEFKEIYVAIDMILHGQATMSITDLKFEEGCNKIKYFRTYLNKVAYIPDNYYFPICHLILTDYREILNHALNTIIDKHFEKISAQHEWETTDICETFEIIQMRATKNPITTEEIIEIGKYMSMVKNQYLDELDERARNALIDLSNLIELGPLTGHHMAINAAMINWLNKILPVLEQNAAIYEQLKFEAEEKLQRIVEEINVNIKDNYPLLQILDDMDDITKVQQYLHTITLHMVKIKDLDKQVSWINQEEVCLSFPKSVYTEFEELKNYVYPFYHLLKLCLDVQRNLYSWLDGQFDLIDYEETIKKVDYYHKELTMSYRAYRGELRLAQDDNVAIRFKGTVDDPDILNWPAPLKLCSKAIQLIDEFKPSLNIIEIMCNKALMKRHWIEMSMIAGFNIRPNAGTTLRKMIKIDLKSNLDQYRNISNKASKEKKLLERLMEIQTEQEQIPIKTLIMESINNTEIITGLEDIENIINDHCIALKNMQCSIFVKPYENEVKQAYNQLFQIKQTVDEIKQVHSLWLRLIPIFLLDEIIKQLPNEEKLLHQVNEIYKRYILEILKNPYIYQLISTSNILEDFKNCSHLLEIINNAVTIYIKQVQYNFPRFYFLSVEEILKILSAAKTPVKLDKDLLAKIFESIHKFEIDYNHEKILLGVVGVNGDLIRFKNNINTSNNTTDKWLLEAENKIKLTINESIIKCYNSKYFQTIVKNFRSTIIKWPDQAIYVSLQIIFTENCDKVLDSGNLQSLCDLLLETNNFLQNLITVLNSVEITIKTRQTISSLIIATCENRNFLQDLANNCSRKTITKSDFKWLAKLRYYLNNDNINNNCVTIKISNASINYGNEYIGDLDRIVVTPTTERCYLTMMEAFNFHLFGAIEGISGTGKTVTIRNLAKLLAVHYVSFNCTPNIQLKILIDLIKGSVSQGSWMLLDNFEKLPPHIISVISEYFAKILATFKCNLKEFSFDDELNQITLRKSCFITITLNSNYCSWSKLPESLKLSFRSVTMPVPDYQIIAKIMLISSGFCKAKDLDVRLVMVHKLLREVLYEKYGDYSLNSIMKVLKICRETDHKQLLLTSDSDEEETIVYNAIKIVNLPKLSATDTVWFHSILTNLFPNIQTLTESQVSNDFIKHVKTCCNLLKIEYDNNRFLSKLIEMNQLIDIYSSLIIVGQTFTGKTTIIKTLAKSLNVDNYEVINTETLSVEQLYGRLVESTSNSWRDDAISRCFRSEKQWIVFDGFLNSEWIEILNSALDQNRQLSLQSGEILLMPKTMKLIFEVDQLTKASPAMLSRCGILFIGSTELNWHTLVKAWILNCQSSWAKKFADYITELFNWLIPPCLDFIKKNCRQLGQIDVCNLHIIKTMMLLIEMYLNEIWNTINLAKDEDLKNILVWIQATFVQAGIWGLSSVLDADSKLKFDEFYKQLWRGLNDGYPFPVDVLDRIEVNVPQEGLLTDYNYIYKQKGNWKLWADVLKTEKIQESYLMMEYFVPTIDSIKYTPIIDMHIKYNYPILITGAPSTGKTIYINDLLINKIDKSKYTWNYIALTTNITANQLQKIILSKLNRLNFEYFKRQTKRTTLMFIDDLNLPSRNCLNASQPCIELMRQYLDHKYWHDLDNSQQIFLDNLNFIAAMTLEGTEKLSARFLRHFNILPFNDLSEETVSRIYSTILFTKWRNNGFSSDIITIVNQIVTTTYNFYKKIQENLKPNLVKIFNRFNLRDISKVIKGCSLLRKEQFDINKKIYFKLWAHEVCRVFGDRLHDSNDKAWFIQNIRSSIEEDEFHEEFNLVFENYSESDNQDLFSILVFGTYSSERNCDRRYDDFADLKQLMNLMTVSLKEYNENNENKLNIVLFDYALMHLSRICRVLTMSGTSALLLGLSGSGRQTLTRLACNLFKQKIFQPEIIQNYSLLNFQNDLKQSLKEAGGYDRPCVFLLNEEQLIDNYNFLEDIDYLLKCGEILDILQLEEELEVLDLVRANTQKIQTDIDVDCASLFLYYQKLCKENLHIIMCLNPLNFNIWKQIKTCHISILNYCYIDYFDKWPNEAFEKIAYTWTEHLEFPNNIQNNLITIFKFIHYNIEQLSTNYFNKFDIKFHLTTSSYLDLILLFSELHQNRQAAIIKKKTKYLVALKKLSFATSQISDMQKSLNDYQPQLEAMTIKAIEMTEQIAKETIEIEKASGLVKTDEKIANKQAAAAQTLKLDCEADLAQAIPILEDAISALNTLKPTDITLVKSMKNPPDAIKLVMAAVCVMKDVKPDRVPDPSSGRKIIDYWGPSKRILGDMNFLQTLKDFDKDHIKTDIITKIRKDYLPHKDFKASIVAKASSAAEGLCKWIIAMEMYDKVAKEVAPKKEKFEKAEKEYAETIIILNEKKDEVTRIEQKLANLNNILDDANRKQKSLQKDVNVCKKKLSRAQKLIDGLSGERTRWTNIVDQLQNQFDALVGDVLLSSGIISYLGPYPKAYRQNALDSWINQVKSLNIPCSLNYNFLDIFQNDIDNEKWQLQNFPADNYFLENTLIMKYSKRWNFLLDPQNQAISLIKTVEKINDVQITELTCDNWPSTVEVAKITDKPVMIRDIKQSIDAYLMNILNATQVNSNYRRIYLSTTLRNYQYSPEMLNKFTVVNCVLTDLSLEEKFLAILVEDENPKLKKLKNTLIVQSIENQCELKEIEEKILTMLSETEHDILDDETALQMLQHFKQKSSTLQITQNEVVAQQENCNDFKTSYKHVAKFTTILYFTVFELTKINYMYQYSLNWFIDLYRSSIHGSEKLRNVKDRCKSIIDTITFNLYSTITRSVFNQDKLLFSLLLCLNILLSKKQINDQDLLFLIKKMSQSKCGNTFAPNPGLEWLPRKCWDKICSLKSLPSLQNFPEHFIQTVDEWKTIYHSTDPENQLFPEPWNSNNFLKVIITSIIRNDRTQLSLTKLISDELGEKFVVSSSFDLNISYYESYKLLPLIFFLTLGSNPVHELEKFARKLHNKLHVTSLGNGNKEQQAEVLIKQGAINGSWICLENCHLSPSWLIKLTRILENMQYDNTHDNFRLWLTTYPTPKFPVVLLENSIKIIMESPEKFKDNLLDVYSKIPVNSTDISPEQRHNFTRLLYSLVYFHCLVQERNKYNCFGWNIPHLFNQSDFNLSALQLKTLMNKNCNSIDQIKYLIGQCNYVSHSCNKWDQKVINVLLSDCISLINLTVPMKTDYQDYINHIKRMPVSEMDTEINGLDKNYIVYRNFQESETILNSLNNIFVINHQEENKDLIIPYINYYENLLTITEDLLLKIPDLNDIQQNKIFTNNKMPSAVDALIFEEIEQLTKVLKIVSCSLNNFRLMLKKYSLMPKKSDDFAQSLLANKIPEFWIHHIYSSNCLSLSNYIDDLISKTTFCRSWFMDENKPAVIRLSNFYYPKAYLSAVKLTWSGEQSSIYQLQVINDFVNKPPDSGVYISGLILVGARWNLNDNCLDELPPKVLEYSMPVVWFRPTKRPVESYDKECYYYECPLYKTLPSRIENFDLCNYIVSVLLQTNVAPCQWVKRNVALCCQLNVKISCN